MRYFEMTKTFHATYPFAWWSGSPSYYADRTRSKAEPAKVRTVSDNLAVEVSGAAVGNRFGRARGIIRQINQDESSQCRLTPDNTATLPVKGIFTGSDQPDSFRCLPHFLTFALRSRSSRFSFFLV